MSYCQTLTSTLSKILKKWHLFFKRYKIQVLSKMSNDRQIYNTFPLRKVDLNKKINLEQGTPVEVFRNNTTAVEVIIKEVSNRSKRKEPSVLQENKTHSHDDLKKEDASNDTIEIMRKGFSTVIYEMKMQLDEINKRNLEMQMHNLALQLENHKLKTLLDYKTHFIGKLKKEFYTIKHSLKFVIKSLGYIAKIPYNVPVLSDTDYEDFVNGLKYDDEVKNPVVDAPTSSVRSKDRISH